MWAINAFKSLTARTTVNDVRLTQVAHKFGYGPNRPRQKFPIWFLKKERKVYDEQLSKENENFLQKVVEEKYGKPVIKRGVFTYDNPTTSLIKSEKLPQVEWTPKSTRVGLMGIKIGNYPIWLKSGKRIITTAIQILDNHVIKYTPPEHNNPSDRRHLRDYSKTGMVLMGSGSVDPNTLTANYMGLFKESGVMPKKNLTRFNITADAALPPGTELNVLHYQPGQFVDVRGLTIDRGFCGVMKRWKFKGQPATHGATKTHRRPGSIGGGLRARVWPGKKMPGHMGNRWRIQRGLKIYRINRKYNTMWVSGHSIPGNVNGLVYIYDTKMIRKKSKSLHFPTFQGDESKIPEDWYDEEVHQFGEPTIFFEPEK